MTVRGLLAGAVVALGLAPATAVASPAGTTSPRSGETDAAIRLELIDQTMAFEKDGTIVLEYRVAGDLEAATIVLPPEPKRPKRKRQADEQVAEPPRLAVQVTNYSGLDDVERLDSVIGSDVDRLAFGFATDGVEIPDARDLIEVNDGIGVLRLEIPTDSGISTADRLLFDAPGLHALRVELVRGEPEFANVLATAGTVVQRLPNRERAPLHLALVGAVGEPPLDADEETRTEAIRAVEDLAALAANTDAPFSLSLPPRTVEEATSGDSPDLAASLDGDELLSRPAAPLDVSSAAEADRVDVFTRQLRAGEDLLTDAVPTAPVRRDIWIADQPLSAAGAQALRDLGVRFVTMQPELFATTVDGALPATDRFVEIVLPDGGSLPLLVVDEIGDELSPDLVSSLSPTEQAVRTASTLLLESVLVPKAGQRSRIVASDDFGPLDPTLLSAFERLVTTTPDLEFTIGSSLTGLTSSQHLDFIPVTVTLPERAGPDLSDRVALLDGASSNLFRAAAMLPPNDPRLAEWAAAIDALISTGYTDEQVQAEVDDLLSAADQVRSAVIPPDPFTFTLTGKEGEIELLIGNTSDDELTVVVDLSSPKLVFPEGEATVTLAPNDETRVVVPVEARANGTSAVTVEVKTPAGEVLGEPVKLTSRVTTFTGLGQVLTGGLVLVLLTWWFTHWRARRRSELDEGAERHPAGTGSIVRP